MERIKNKKLYIPLNIQRFADSSNTVEVELVAVINELQSSINKANGSLDGLKGKIKGVKSEASGLKGVAKEIQSAFSGINLSGIFNSIKRLGKSLYSNFLEKAVDTSEELNLFNVVFDNIEKNGKTTFSELGEEANKFQNKLNEAFGTNKKETMRYQGLFQSMGESSGLSEEVAALMSENMTKLSYDLASLYNTTETKAAESLRAGVYAGQTKPLRNYGIDVTQTSFKPIMAELGLDKSVNELTQAEKEVLRYISTLRQAQNAMGDFANTIESPANQLKVLKQQFYEMQAAIGNLFVGAFARILPYVNAIIMVIKELAKIIASFFGIKMKDYNTGISSYASDLDDYSASLGGVGDSAKGASDSIKELKRQTLGFDQINNITSPTPKSGSGGSGGGGGGGIAGGIDKSLLDAIKGYENGMEKVRMKASKIRDAIMEWLGFTKKVNEKTGEITWKLKEGWSNIKTIGVILGGALVLGTIKKILDTVIKIHDWGKKLKEVFGGASTASTAAKGGGLLGISGLGWAGIFASATVQATNLVHQVKKIKETYEETGSLADAMKLDSVGDFFSKALAMNTIQNVFGVSGILVTGLLNFGATIDKIKDAWKGLGSGVRQEVADIKKKLDPIKTELYTFGSDIAQLKMGVVIDEDTKNTTMQHLEDLTGKINGKLEEEKKKMVEKLNKMLSEGIISQEEYDEAVKKVDNLYNGLASSTEEAQKNIKTILETAASEHRKLTADEIIELQKNYDTINKNTVESLTKNKNEQSVLLNEIKTQNEKISVETASTMIQQAIKTRDDTIQAAKDQYDGTVKEYKNLKNLGIISEEQYNKVVESAKKTKKDTINEAKEQYDEIYNGLKENNKDIATYIDKDTGGIKKSWKNHYKDLNEETVKEYDKIKKKTETGIQNIGKIVAQNPIKITADTTELDRVLSSIDTKINGKKYKMETNANGEINFRKYAMGGLPSTGEFFIAREAGPEMVGRIGNRTAVANNDQIISGIQQGVYNAVSAAMGGGIGSVQIDLHTDEGVVVDRINKITRQTGECPINF